VGPSPAQIDEWRGLDVVPACPTILNVIGDLLADGWQIEEFPLNEDIFSLFGKL
jgi:hypothetical protein